MPPQPALSASMAAIAARVRALEALYREIAATRMAGLPLLHPRLQVQALGFEPMAGDPPWLCGVLITPWFMNLLRLPLHIRGPAGAGGNDGLSPGQRGARSIGARVLDFVGAHEPGLGRFEASSLFSPMFEFADHAAAQATAAEVLQQLRTPAPAVVGVPARRSFLLGRAARGAQR